MAPFLMRSARFWMGVGLVVLAIALLALNGDAIAEEQHYARDGQVADGLVVGKAINRSMRAGSSEAATEYTVTYRFMLAGDSFEGEQRMSRDAWDRVREMDPVKIEYVTADPSSSRIAGHTGGRAPYVLGGAGLIAGVIGLVALSRAMRESRLQT